MVSPELTIPKQTFVKQQFRVATDIRVLAPAAFTCAHFAPQNFRRQHHITFFRHMQTAAAAASPAELAFFVCKLGNPFP